jgi:mono/diheme cytochrome c family protein
LTASSIARASVLAACLHAPAWAQAPSPRSASGADLYAAACVTCHGVDGRGASESRVGFDTPLPDFTDCSFATREPDADWLAISHDGGPVRAFSRRMPAFGQALSEAELARVLGHIRQFCSEPAWPPGELNFPRPLVTEKAYPEDEAVLTTRASDGAVVNELLYERRFGARSQVEIVVPIEVRADDGGAWQRGLGDVGLAVKHALIHSRRTGTILSPALEVVLPTGKETQGLGRGFSVVEPFVAFGQMLPSEGFLQAQGGFEIPLADDAEDEVFWRVAVGKTFTRGRFGRSWSPIVELIGATGLGGGTPAWDVMPQTQVTLSRRQHVMINAGVRIPVNRRDDRGAEFVAYFLWDWFDGGLFEGWK